MAWFVLKSPQLSLSVRDKMTEAGLDYFLPTHTVLQNVGGKQKRVERPLALNMVFVQSVFEDVRQFCQDNPMLRLAMVYGRRPVLADENAKPLIIPNSEMEMFQKAISFYTDEEIPFVKPEEMELEKGDIVRIIGGQFSGLEGVLVSQKGKDGGRVVVNLSNVIAIRTLEIEPEYLQVLRFGKDNKHFYKHIDSYVPRLEKVWGKMADAKKRCVSVDSVKYTSAELVPIETFVSRFSVLQTDTLNSDAKVKVLLYASYRVLGRVKEAEDMRMQIDAIKNRLKSAKTLEFVEKWCEY